MTKNRKKRESSFMDGFKSVFSLTSKETANGILAVFSIVVAIFLILGSFELAGRAGNLTYVWLSYFFGIGYYLLPIVFLLLAISLIQEQEREFATPQIIGSVVLFISSLGLVDFMQADSGVVGNFISRPLAGFFDIYVSTIILLALVVISILIIFNTSIRIDIASLIRKLFGKKEKVVLAQVEDSVINKAVENMEARQGFVKPVPIREKAKSEEEGFTPMIVRRSGKRWTPPPLSLLEGDRGKAGVGDIKANANLIKRTLQNFGMKPAEGVKLSKILGLQTNLELALAAHPIRIEAPIPGKSLVGIEVPNMQKSTIGLGSLVGDSEFTDSPKPLLAALGRDIAGASHYANIAKMPHMLIAGATGSGKSVSVHAVVTSLLYKNPPENLKFIMVDPKRVELTLYNSIPHLLTPVITDPKKAILALKWVAKEMDRRYDILEKSSSRDIDSYHKNILSPALEKSKKDDVLPDPMPYIVVIIDELADLMQSYPRELEAAIVRLAQMSRAVGIHLILSTQRPSVNVITGLIKANVPARIAFQVASQIDSRTILDAAGAEKLLGAGDMLFQGEGMSKPLRIQGAFISEKEVKAVTKYLRDEYADELQDEISLTTENTSNAIFSASLEEDSFDGDDDELYEQARQTVLEAGKASTSFLQRKLRIGYARAARLVDMLEDRGVIGAGSGAKAREVISPNEGTGQTSEETEALL